MERELLLLGLLRSQDMHGYQLHEAIDSHLGMVVQLTKPTAYGLLSNMAGKFLELMICTMLWISLKRSVRI